MAGGNSKEAQTLEYFIVDVFTESALAGNPLAVVIDTVGLATERMQAIAREFNLSETAFVQRRPAEVERAEGVRVRIFTTKEELPFAGHPTLGTAAVLKLTDPLAPREETITLALNVGPIPVNLQAPEGSSSVFGSMRQRDPEFGEVLDATEVARLIDLDQPDLDAKLPPQVVSTGNPFAIVVLRTAAPLERLRVRHEEAMGWLRARGARWFYVLGRMIEFRPEYRARMQFNGGEDPATGSAAGCAISYLVARGAVLPETPVFVQQGVEIGRPSDLYLSAKIDPAGRVRDVQVGGRTVLVARGRLFLP